MPFTEFEFFENFRAYNTALWPAIVLVWLAALVLVVRLIRGQAAAPALRLLSIVQWSGVGLVFHAGFFSSINPAAWLFAAMFVVHAALLAANHFGSQPLVYRWTWDRRHALAGMLMIYALVYPALSAIGRTWETAPLFLVPCPLLLLDTGLLLTSEGRVPRRLLVVPILWALIGGSAAVLFGVWPDLALFACAAILFTVRRGDAMAHLTPVRISIVIVASLTLSASAKSAPDVDAISGSRRVHVVQAGESLAGLGARFGVEPRVLAAMNFLRPGARLRAGQWIVIDDRHIVPVFEGTDGVVVSVPQRMLFRFAGGALAAAYPVVVGPPERPAFLGGFTVTAIGQRWIGIDRPGGRIRLHPDDAAALAGANVAGMAGRSVYQPVLLAETESGAILLEAHPDVYGLQANALAIVDALAAQRCLMQRIDWALVSKVLRDRDGTPVEVSIPMGR